MELVDTQELLTVTLSVEVVQAEDLIKQVVPLVQVEEVDGCSSSI